MQALDDMEAGLGDGITDAVEVGRSDPALALEEPQRSLPPAGPDEPAHPLAPAYEDRRLPRGHLCNPSVHEDHAEGCRIVGGQ